MLVKIRVESGFFVMSTSIRPQINQGLGAVQDLLNSGASMSMIMNKGRLSKMTQ